MRTRRASSGLGTRSAWPASPSVRWPVGSSSLAERSPAPRPWGRGRRGGAGPTPAAAARGEGGGRAGGASRGRGGGAAASSACPPPPQGPCRSLRGGGAHSPRRAARLAAAAANETHRGASPAAPSALRPRRRVPRARSPALLPCGRLRHGVGVGGAGGGGAGLRQPVPAGEPRRVLPRPPALPAGRLRPFRPSLRPTRRRGSAGRAGPGRAGRAPGCDSRPPRAGPSPPRPGAGPGGREASPDRIPAFPAAGGSPSQNRDPQSASTWGHSFILFPSLV